MLSGAIVRAPLFNQKRKKILCMSGIKSLGISHVGIAVKDLDKAILDYSSLFDFENIERLKLESEGVRIAMLRAGTSELELLCPTGEEGPIARYIHEKGEGVHHVAIRVPNVGNAIQKAEAIGLRVIDAKPRTGARGAEAAFVHPKSLHGVLLEFYNR
jgi:methylmalonyl-CoA/ethylmalonyl-CoA epimerase